jgi:hypothetical protein
MGKTQILLLLAARGRTIGTGHQVKVGHTNKTVWKRRVSVPDFLTLCINPMPENPIIILPA